MWTNVRCFVSSTTFSLLIIPIEIFIFIVTFTWVEIYKAFRRIIVVDFDIEMYSNAKYFNIQHLTKPNGIHPDNMKHGNGLSCSFVHV